MTKPESTPDDIGDALPDELPGVDSKQKQSFFQRITKRREKAREGFLRLKEQLGQERQETKDMMAIYHRAAEGTATKEEIKKANEQFGDLLRIAGMGTFFTLIPGSTLLLPFAVIGARKVGVRLLPTSFSKHDGLKESDEASEEEDGNT